MVRTIPLDYYDTLLAGIAASLALGALLGATAAVEFYEGIVLGSLVATAFLYLGLFRNPPVPPDHARARVAVVVWHVYLGLLVLAGVV